MAYQSVFKRYEMKYLLTASQKAAVWQALEPYMALDRYGRTTIQNLYYDTEDFRLIRHSMEGPPYKEKLRLRSYGKASPEGPAFVELKKKYNSVVYKRRVSLPEREAVLWLSGQAPGPADRQITREIDYFCAYYPALRPVVFLSYEREAFYSRDGGDFRVTFDENILCRREELSLETEAWGAPILEPGKTLMEVKCSGGMPLWMARLLAREGIYKTSFSKYGTAYQHLIYPNLQGGYLYA